MQLSIQIPWNKHYFCQWWIFHFVPKIFINIKEDGYTWEEKNEEAKFKISL